MSVSESDYRGFLDRWMPEATAVLALCIGVLGYLFLTTTAMVQTGWFFIAIGIVGFSMAAVVRWEVGY